MVHGRHEKAEQIRAECVREPAADHQKIALSEHIGEHCRQNRRNTEREQSTQQQIRADVAGEEGFYRCDVIPAKAGIHFFGFRIFACGEFRNDISWG